ncbi:hypothetical protein LE181_09475 [Streptomyces sp. SCA3-4]|uniref:hypothetical protein n=1 Tax=Streptomyces sichuanensis TaxID=2871810 RepID=UPI001CE375E3|nr:hypothetical protein [Streptomyces sichuanensis]MCA6092390.1 hypothetical protein [Streptomyces sichuanensis]
MPRLAQPWADILLHDVLGNYLAALLSALSLWGLRAIHSSQRQRPRGGREPGDGPGAGEPDEQPDGTPDG